MHTTAPKTLNVLQVLNLTIQVTHTAPKRFHHFMEAAKNKTQGQPLPFQLLLFFHQHQVLPQQNAASRVSDNLYNQPLISHCHQKLSYAHYFLLCPVIVSL